MFECAACGPLRDVRGTGNRCLQKTVFKSPVVVLSVERIEVLKAWPEN